MKKIYCLLICGLLTLAACTEEFSPSIDYGARTYINDYQKLVDAVNNLTSSLEERMNALNKLLETGLADIKISVDVSTNDIQILSATIGEGFNNVNNTLNNINVTLLDGFKSLKTVIQDNGDRIVYALNSNGDLIALHLDENGRLIDGTIKAQVGLLIQTLKDNNASMQSKLDAINTIIETGLANIVVKIGDIGSNISVKLEANGGMLDSLTDALAQNFQSLNNTILEGFAGLNSTLQDNGDRIVYAINNNGDLIALHLDQNGQLIETAIKAQTTNLVAALQDHNASLQAKLDAMSTIIETGLGNVIVKIGNMGEGIEAKLEVTNTTLGTINTTLGTINSNLLEGFSSVETAISTSTSTITSKINDNITAVNTLKTDVITAIGNLQTAVNTQGGNMVSAVNTQGQLIIAAIGSNGELISALNTNVVTTLGTCTTTLNDAITATRNTELAQILEKLSENNNQTETLLNLQNGVTFPDPCPVHSTDEHTTYEYMYLTPTLFQAINADATLNAAFQHMLCEVSVTPRQLMRMDDNDLPMVPVICSDNKSVSGSTQRYNYLWEVSDKAPAKLMVTGTVVIDGHYSLVVRNVCEWTDMKFTYYDDTYKYVFFISAVDAKPNDPTLSSCRALYGSPHSATGTGENMSAGRVFRFYNYDTDTGVFMPTENILTQPYAASVQ